MSWHLEFFFDMFDFPNFHLKISHDPSFKLKSVQHKSCSYWYNLSKKSNFIPFGQSMSDLCMAWTWMTIWHKWTWNFHTQLHGLPLWLQQCLYLFLDLKRWLHGPITRPCTHEMYISIFGALISSVHLAIIWL